MNVSQGRIPQGSWIKAHKEPKDCVRTLFESSEIGRECFEQSASQKGQPRFGSYQPQSEGCPCFFFFFFEQFATKKRQTRFWNYQINTIIFPFFFFFFFGAACSWPLPFQAAHKSAPLFKMSTCGQDGHDAEQPLSGFLLHQALVDCLW